MTKEVAKFSSNEMRLSLWQWFITVVIVGVLVCFLPFIWTRLEKFEPGINWRFPRKLSNDYWMYSRYCRSVCAKEKTLIIGDSVIWGQYVKKEQTLSHCLNELVGRQHFANMAMAGAHPAALAGLIEHYGTAISAKNVILHFNPLWLSSKKRDLQTDKEFHFNHPRLVPQFFPDIPCYTASISTRIGIIIERNAPFLGWTNHLQTVCFMDDNGVPGDLPAWTMAHPYDNPFKAVTPKLPELAEDISSAPKPWTESSATKRDFPWVELETSLQWSSFRRLVNLLQDRGNTVFVLVGPLNEHMMNEKSLAAYRKIKTDIEIWLMDNNISYYIPPPLPSRYYADASHPLSDGYALLATQLFDNGIGGLCPGSRP
jgi:DNA-binding transcriptional regulator of glucitol operon